MQKKHPGNHSSIYLNSINQKFIYLRKALHQARKHWFGKFNFKSTVSGASSKAPPKSMGLYSLFQPEQIPSEDIQAKMTAYGMY